MPESVFKNLQPFFEKDRSVSNKHLYLEEKDKGIVLCDISTNGTTAVDYKLNQVSLKRTDLSNRNSLVALLVPKDIEENSIECGALFGGKDNKKYQLKIDLKKRELQTQKTE